MTIRDGLSPAVRSRFENCAKRLHKLGVTDFKMTYPPGYSLWSLDQRAEFMIEHMEQFLDRRRISVEIKR